MEREEAAVALTLLRKVVAQARDDTAVQNFGVIWMCSAFSNGGGFAATHVLLSRGHLSPAPYVAVWAVVFTLNGVFILAFKKKGRGAPSFIERQTWAIWNTCVAAMALAAVINYLMGISTMLFMPAVASLVAAVTFSTMGALMGRWWYLPAGVWAAMALVMALVPRLQFALFAALWWLTQGTSGYLLHRAKVRASVRASAGAATMIGGRRGRAVTGSDAPGGDAPRGRRAGRPRGRAGGALARRSRGAARAARASAGTKPWPRARRCSRAARSAGAAAPSRWRAPGRRSCSRSTRPSSGRSTLLRRRRGWRSARRSRG